MTAYYNEYDPKAAALLRELIRCGLIADGVVDERSILDVEPADLAGFIQVHCFAGIGGWSLALRLAGWPDDRPVWTGSPPCQPFSAAGRQLGRDDERHLAPHFASLVAACRPGTLFGEQVASAAVFGKASSRSGKSVEGQAPLEWAWLDDLFERLEAAHYACGASDIPAAGVGAAHIRQRTFFGAQRLDDPAGPRHDGPFAGPEGLARDETWLRLSGAGSGHGGLADAERLGPAAGLPTSAGRHGGVADVVGDGGDRQSGRGQGQSGAGRLADTLHAGRPERRPLAGGGSVAGGRGGLCGLADADSGQRGRVADGERRLGHGAATGWQQGDGEPERGGERGGLANSDGGDARAEREQRGGQQRQQPQDGDACLGPLPQGSAPDLDGRGPDAPDSPWRVADWLFCRDGKWRPVEARAQSLVDGLPAGMGRGGDLGGADDSEEKARSLALGEIGFPLGKDSYARVARLRGYGNAIVPQAAAEFIKAFDAAAECLRLNDLPTMTTDNEGVFG